MEPAGEMWSVVMESPNSAMMRAPCTGRIGPARAARALQQSEVLEERRLGDVGALGPGVGGPVTP
jgi:hypothetical protein